MKCVVVFLLLSIINNVNTLAYDNNDFYLQAIASNDRYQNYDVPWGRPKCLYCGDLAGSGPEQKANLYPDMTSTYFVANIKLELGWTLIINGEYPFARYFSFTVANQLNDGQLGQGSFLRGDQINPDKGSVNPYLPNVNRYSPNRNYTIYLVQGYPNPEGTISNNTLYTPTERTHLSLRVYLPDLSYDGTGHRKYGLPVINLLLPTGQIVTGPKLVRMLDARKLGDPNGYQLDEWLSNIKASKDPLNAPVSEIPKAELFLNTPYSVSGLFITNPEEKLYRYPANSTGGFANNPDTKYLIIPYSFGYGEVLVIQGVKPTHQYTRHNNQYIYNDTQVQYFSVSTGAGPCSGAGWDTEYDENIPDYYTIVVSWPWNRPANAIKDNNVTWLTPGSGEGHYVTGRTWIGMVYIRYQNPNPSWEQSPAYIPIPTYRDPFLHTEEVMGIYYPRSKYMSKSDFESNY
jgi:hypothetical protein